MTMMHIERRKGKDVPVIKKALVEMDSHIFKIYEKIRDHWFLFTFNGLFDIFITLGQLMIVSEIQDLSNLLDH